MGFSGKPNVLRLNTIDVKLIMWTVLIRFARQMGVPGITLEPPTLKVG